MGQQEKESENTQADLGEIIIYQSEDGNSAIDVHLKDETVWLTLNQMGELFDRDKSVISRHLRNIFQAGELERDTTVAKNATVQTEGGRRVTRDIERYNLDAIISVGYRVNSKRGTQFRIWATAVLKEHIVRGYTLNQRRLVDKGSEEIRQMVSLLSNTLESQALINDEGRGVLDIINRYAKTWRLLLQYDEDNLPVPGKKHEVKSVLELDDARQAIAALKGKLLGRGEATDIFGHERDQGLAGILGAVQQTFGG
ncbi:MAG TPA: hypothetical protein ENH34_04465, partial [Phycisphaerales bacterium]|nr:hypothetical protein [Phycisphaerales bacterium]